MRKIFAAAALVPFLAIPAMALDTEKANPEQNKQVPAAQSTEAPDSNAKAGGAKPSAKVGETVDGAASGASSGQAGSGPATNENSNTTAPAPNNTAPQK